MKSIEQKQIINKTFEIKKNTVTVSLYFLANEMKWIMHFEAF